MSVRTGRSALNMVANCVRTGCHNDVTFNPRNPPLYCSTHCRVSAARDQKWLLAEQERLTQELRDANAARELQIADRLKIVQWHLRRYAPAWGVSTEGREGASWGR